MQIREARPEDAQAIHVLIVSAVSPDRHQDFDDIGWQRCLDMNSPEAIGSRIGKPGYLTLLCEAEDRLAGLLAIKQYEKIDQLFVHPDFRRKGVARKLWETARSLCEGKRGTLKYWVKSSSMGVPVYQSFGFVLAAGRQTEQGISYYPMTYTVTDD